MRIIQPLNVLNRLVEHYGEQHWWEDENWLKDCISMILIQQATQANVEKALENLTACWQLDTLAQIPLDELQQKIRPSGFYKQKANYIKNVVAFLQAHGGEPACFAHIPTAELRRKLLAIKGVGAETADVMLLYLFGRKMFIGDSYAIRLFNRLGFGNFQHYAEIQQAFQSLTEHATLKQCKEWHACIDVHGKHHRQNPQLDEGFLLE